MRHDGRNRNIIVCVKQVTDLGAKRPEFSSSSADDTSVHLNSFDSYALEAAARLRDRNPDIHITALSLGRSQEDEALRQALAIAADEAFLAVVPNPDFLDPLSVSRLLAQAIQMLEEKLGTADLIFCGQQSTDSQSAQVGPQLAQFLHLPVVCHSLEAESAGKTLRIKQKTWEGIRVVEAELPCVAAFTKPAWNPRLPTVKSSITASQAIIPTLEMPILPVPALTMQTKCFVSQKAGGVMIREQEGKASAQKLYQLLNTAGVI